MARSPEAAPPTPIPITIASWSLTRFFSRRLGARNVDVAARGARLGHLLSLLQMLAYRPIEQRPDSKTANHQAKRAPAGRETSAMVSRVVFSSISVNEIVSSTSASGPSSQR
jgi:hypothetical protein